MMPSRSALAALMLLSLSVACRNPAPTSSPPSAAPADEERVDEPETVAESPDTESLHEHLRAIIAAPDRSEADRALDEQRKPLQMLEFFGIRTGMRVAELAAGGGYTAELLARAVGPQGHVYAQNTPFILQRFAEKPWSERLTKPVMENVKRIDSELESPLPPDASHLDAVLMVLFYHDTVWFKTDRAKMNAAIFHALRPGGIFGLVDHSAKAGAGVSEAETLHRIEESVVIAELEAAGFILDASADFLRRSEDSRDWNASPSQAGERRGQSDRFVLRFIKPLTDSPAADETDSPAQRIACSEPRRKECTRDYRPVCADYDTQIRCITTPCPSSERRTYANACSACADEKVSGYSLGPCENSQTP